MQTTSQLRLARIYSRRSVSAPENYYLEALFVKCLQLLGDFLAEIFPVICIDWKCGCPLGAYQRAVLSIANNVDKGNALYFRLGKSKAGLTISKAAILLDCFKPACL